MIHHYWTCHRCGKESKRFEGLPTKHGNPPDGWYLGLAVDARAHQRGTSYGFARYEFDDFCPECGAEQYAALEAAEQEAYE